MSIAALTAGGVRAAAAPIPVDPADPSNFPAANVQVPRTGLTTTMKIGGGILGGIGVVTAAAALIAGRGPMVRPDMATLFAAGAAALVGGGVFAGSFAVGPKTESALAAGIPSRALAELVDAKVPGSTKIVQTADGKFAILRAEAPSTGGGGGSSRPRYDDDDDYRPSRPSRPRPDNDYPSSGGGGRTSPGDSPSRPDPPRPAPPRPDPPRPNPPSNNGNSSSNGNPSEDDF